jgi:hypothetical protein
MAAAAAAGFDVDEPHRTSASVTKSPATSHIRTTAVEVGHPLRRQHGQRHVLELKAGVGGGHITKEDAEEVVDPAQVLVSYGDGHVRLPPPHHHIALAALVVVVKNDRHVLLELPVLTDAEDTELRRVPGLVIVVLALQLQLGHHELVVAAAQEASLTYVHGARVRHDCMSMRRSLA